MVLINLICIQLLVVFIVDISGAIDSLKSGLKWILTKGKMSSSDYRLKPIDCSLCMTFWSGLIYLWCVGSFTLPWICIVGLLAAFSGLAKSTILLFEDIVVRIINYIYNKFID